MWTSAKDKEEISCGDNQGQRETCAYRSDIRRQRQTSYSSKKADDGPAYISSAAMSAVDIYPY